MGICVRAGGAPTGDDALAMSLSSVLPVDIQWIYLVSDLVVLAASLSYIPLNKIMYSLLTVILSGQIIGVMQKIRLQNLRQWQMCLRVRERRGKIPVNYFN